MRICDGGSSESKVGKPAGRSLTGTTSSTTAFQITVATVVASSQAKNSNVGDSVDGHDTPTRPASSVTVCSRKCNPPTQ